MIFPTDFSTALITQAKKYLDETGKGHMDRPEHYTRAELYLMHGFVIWSPIPTI